MTLDPIRLEVFKHLFSAIAEEMGVVLRKASYSPNIKERRDYSCAIFDTLGNMIAQAAHIPVHLGSMPLSVAAAIDYFKNDATGESSQDRGTNTNQGLNPGDVVILNDPYLGGTHLPDITLISPVFVNLLDIGENPQFQSVKSMLFGFVASRAHHADIGGMTPGSMPLAREIYQEGLIIPPLKLIDAGSLNQAVWDLILANVRTPQERSGDLLAQIAANQRGATRLQELLVRYGRQEVSHYMEQLLAYTERMTRRLLGNLPDGVYTFSDYMDNDGVDLVPVPITVTITISGEEAVVDFTGSAPQQKGSINAVYAITLSAVYYVFRSLIGLDVPNNSGCLVPIHIIAPAGTVVNALHPSPVAGGNVETSQRIVDVLLGALAKACPDQIPAASQGTMNNVTIGGWDTIRNTPFTYYETIGGGMGARPWADGQPAIHSHMTNTLNTPIEALEYTYPLRIRRYEIRQDSAGGGNFRGGEGIRRDIELLTDAQVTLLSERRLTTPYGLSGGSPGAVGENILIREGVEDIMLPGKTTLYLQKGDVLSVRTPGGGGHGSRLTG